MNDGLQTYGESLVVTFNKLLEGTVVFVPKLIFALVVFLVGLFVAVTLGRVVMQAIRALKVDHVLRNLGAEEYIERAGWHLDSGAFVGVLAYLPQVIVAALVLLVGAVVGDLAGHVVSGTARAAAMPSSGFLGSVARWAIWIFAFVAALLQLGLFQELLLTLVQAFVFMLAGAGALAFGLGGKEHASQFIEKLKSDLANHH